MQTSGQRLEGGHMPDRLDPVTLFVTAFTISAMAGVAALLRTNKSLTIRIVASAALNSGALGMGIALVLFTVFKENTWFLLGLCLLAGLGGMTFLGIVLTIFRQGGFNVNVKVPRPLVTATGEDESEDPKDQTEV